jgi:malate permease and related proteins
MPESAWAKTLSLLLLIAVGAGLKRKIAAEQVKGLKTLILTVALPATIFLALMRTHVRPELLWLPVWALAFNLIMLALGWVGLRWHPLGQAPAQRRTLLMLFPSLAPGLSCFPFLAEYLGKESLAQAAVADVGNKVFVLILLYLLAMRWHYARQARPTGSSRSRVRVLLLTLVREPINLVILGALLLLGLGVRFGDLPAFLQSTVARLGLTMTPLVLLFIGLAVKVSRHEVLPLLSLLLLRSGAGLLLSALLILALPAVAPLTALLIVVFPQSACSFWPYAHMSAVRALEEEQQPTFDLDLGVNVLAFSLPFSTSLILLFAAVGPQLATPWLLTSIGAGFLLLGALPGLYQWCASMAQRRTEGIAVKQD